MTVVAAPQLRRARAPIVVTGGCGFIGCNIARALADRGDDVLVIDTLARAGTEENADWLRELHPDRIALETVDIRDADGLRPLLARAGAVIHLAAQVAVTTSLESPIDDFEINIRGTLNVLEAVRRLNPNAPVLYASTNKVYGKLLDEEECVRTGERCLPAGGRYPAGVPETAPLDLYSPYGCSKGAADQYVRDYARVFGLRTAVLRMSCIYGPRQFGTEDQGWIAHFLLRARHGDPITIYGDGYQVRDALFIDDAVAAWLGVLDGIGRHKGQIFNLGGGPENAVSLREMMGLIAEMRGEAPELRFDAWRPGDQPWYVSDITRITQALGWRPGVRLREGLLALDGWLQSRFARPAPAPAARREARA